MRHSDITKEAKAFSEEERQACIAECEAINARILSETIKDTEWVDDEQKDVWTRNVNALVKAYAQCEENVASSCIKRALEGFIKKIVEQFGHMDSYYIQEIATNLVVIAVMKETEA